MPRIKKLNIIGQLARDRKLLQVSANIGSCDKCALRDSCSYVNDTDTSCRAINVSTEQFIRQATLSEFTTDRDLLGIRALASLHGIITVFEMYFSKYGIVDEHHVDGETFIKVKDMTKEYTKLLNMYQLHLGYYGLHPKGREQIKATIKGSPHREESTAFHDYLDAKVDNVQSKGKNKHNRFLSGPASSESETSRSSDSDPEVDLSDPDEF